MSKMTLHVRVLTWFRCHALLLVTVGYKQESENAQSAWLVRTTVGAVSVWVGPKNMWQIASGSFLFVTSF